MPVYLELLDSIFGKTEDERNPTYFTFRDRIFLEGADDGHEMPTLGRSGRHFQLTYVLKAIFQGTAADSWDVGPAAFYHHFDTETGASFWLNTFEGNELFSGLTQIALPQEFGSTAQHSELECGARFALKVHLFNANWAFHKWSSYIEWLEKKIKKEAGTGLQAITQR